MPDWFGQNNSRSFALMQFDTRNDTNATTGGYSNPRLNAVIARASSASTAALAEREWHEAARFLMDDVALVPLT